MEVAKSCYSCQSWNACEYSEIESLLFVEHVEYVNILNSYWIVEVLSPEGILKIDNIGICV